MVFSTKLLCLFAIGVLLGFLQILVQNSFGFASEIFRRYLQKFLKRYFQIISDSLRNASKTLPVIAKENSLDSKESYGTWSRNYFKNSFTDLYKEFYTNWFILSSRDSFRSFSENLFVNSSTNFLQILRFISPEVVLEIPSIITSKIHSDNLSPVLFFCKSSIV